MRILHVTPWFPTEENPLHAIYVERQINSLSGLCQQMVLHIDLNFGAGPNLRTQKNGVLRIQQRVVFTSWRLREWIFYRILKRELRRLNAHESFSHINFFIAYPALIHYGKLKPYLPVKKLITEHWSAYQFNFNVESVPDRLRKIFHHEIPLAVVSHSLANDIRKFSGVMPPITVIPNVVDTKIFNCQNQIRGNYYFTVSLWKYPKKPLELLEVFRKLKEVGRPQELVIGGYGPEEDNVLKFIKDYDLGDVIRYVGRLWPEQIAEEMNRAKAFILPTDYETFSVVIAEALSCGCPVIASKSGAIPELINDRNGILVDNNWEESLQKFDSTSYDHSAISKSAIEQFSLEVVGAKYFNLLKQL